MLTQLMQDDVSPNWAEQNLNHNLKMRGWLFKTDEKKCIYLESLEFPSKDSCKDLIISIFEACA